MTTITMKAGDTVTWQDEDGRTRSLTLRLDASGFKRGLDQTDIEAKAEDQ